MCARFQYAAVFNQIPEKVQQKRFPSRKSQTDTIKTCHVLLWFLSTEELQREQPSFPSLVSSRIRSLCTTHPSAPAVATPRTEFHPIHRLFLGPSCFVPTFQDMPDIPSMEDDGAPSTAMVEDRSKEPGTGKVTSRTTGERTLECGWGGASRTHLCMRRKRVTSVLLSAVAPSSRAPLACGNMRLCQYDNECQM